MATVRYIHTFAGPPAIPIFGSGGGGEVWDLFDTLGGSWCLLTKYNCTYNPLRSPPSTGVFLTRTPKPGLRLEHSRNQASKCRD